MTSVSLVPIEHYLPQHYAELDDDYCDYEEDDDDGEDMPYHARKNARPFTYGTLPDGFKTSELNHVELTDGDEHLRNGVDSELAQCRPAQQLGTPTKYDRKTIRPSISPSRPVIHKTPTREEFEEMLLERQGLALREQNNSVIKRTQNAAIKKDLDQLQEQFNKNGVFPKPVVEKTTTCAKIQIMPKRLVHLETINLTDENKVTTREPTLIVAALSDRSETPDFPVDALAQVGERSSPYLMLARNSQERQEQSTMVLARPNIGGIEVPLQMPKRQEFEKVGRNVEPHLVQFVMDSSEFWYKPHMSRDDAVAILRNAPPGNFIIRKSTTYKNAYGLVLRVARPPPGAFIEDGTNGLVRHFLLEPTPQGVGLKGCPNVFTSLSALVYQHSIDPMALPCKLVIADKDIVQPTDNAELLATQKMLLSQGAACNVLSLFTFNTEMLTGEEAIRKAIQQCFSKRPPPTPLEVHFKVSQQGITLTDVKRRVFLRRHYPTQCISHIGIDPDKHFWTVNAPASFLEQNEKKTIFAFVARSLIGSKDNHCHLFCDLAPTQPASAIVSFAHKIFPNDVPSNMLI